MENFLIQPYLISDAGLPMITLTFPLMLALLVPVVLIEAWLYRKWLSLGAGAALRSSAIANVASTLVGVPLAWGIMLLFQFGLLGSLLRISRLGHALDRLNGPLADLVLTILAPAWLGPLSKYWMVPLAATILLVPTYILSVWIERFLVYHVLRRPDAGASGLSRPQTGVVVRNANRVSYGLLVLGSSVWLLFGLIRYPR
jgi:hypothetical protein